MSQTAASGAAGLPVARQTRTRLVLRVLNMVASWLTQAKERRPAR